jgi:hypothetical protein
MLAGVVPELGFMHLVTSSKSYKTVSGGVTQPLRRINEMSMIVGEIQHLMTFMIIDTHSYDLLLGLVFLIKIRAVVDVEKRLIHIR